MFKDAQYHELIRKTIVAFGTLFNDLYIYRRSSTGKINQQMKVPLAYGPKQKFLVRLDQDANLDSKFLDESFNANLLNLKGHRSVGGMRASIYNAIPQEAIDDLIIFMKAFESKYG